ncbi:hypothetical protein [Streptomyces goshikiensis]|uniref:hypothetical protein n=1 Tax=Streptomyces goshikiensis TaxID=1942 RepID=UPI0033BEBE53
MIAAAASTPPTAIVVAVVVFCLIASGVCFVAAIAIWAKYERGLANVIEDAKEKLKDVRPRAVDEAGRPLNPNQEQAGPAFDFAALANLADAMEKLPVSGRLLVVSLGFAAIAAVAAGAGSIASAVS